MAKKHRKAGKQAVGTILGTLRAIKVRKPLTNFIAGKQLHKIKRR